MTKFRCLRSGNIISFTSEDDIEQMRKHEGYTEIKESQDGMQDEKGQEAPEARKTLKLKKANHGNA